MKNHMRFKLWIILTIIWCLILTSSAFSAQESLNKIKASIKAHGLQWTPKESWVTRLSREEFRKLLGARPSEARFLEFESPPLITEELLTSIDWRDMDGHSYVTPIRNQESCGSCAAFAAIAALESRIAIECYRPDEDIDLSEMDVFNCGGGDCESGMSHYAAVLQLLLYYYGAPDEACWPYEPINMSCSNSCSNRNLRSTYVGYYSPLFGEYACKQAVCSSPIIARMTVYSDLKWYGGGIYEPAPNAEFEGYHAVCIVGYVDEGFDHYWIVKNSWGDEWGEDGFFRIKMGECDIETGANEYNFFIFGVVFPLPPAAPSNLEATAVSKNQVNLSWQDNSNNEIGFEIHRKKDGGTFSLIDTVGEDITSYADFSAEEGTKYYYEVLAYNIGWKSSSNTDSVTTPLTAPSNLNAAIVTSTKIRVTWSDNSSTESGFEIWEKKGSGSWQKRTTVGANVTLKDLTVEEGIQYGYKVRAYNAYTTSGYSNTDYETTPWTQPAKPTNLNAVASEGMIELWWQDNSHNETGFKIVRKKEGQSSFSHLNNVGKNVTHYQDTTAEAGYTYYYKVRAYNPEYNSSYSNVASAEIPLDIPEAPDNLDAEFSWGSQAVELTWSDGSDNEQGFFIERKDEWDPVWWEIAEVGENVTYYEDHNVYGDTFYYYRVRAYNQAGYSPYSNVANVYVPWYLICIAVRAGNKF